MRKHAMLLLGAMIAAPAAASPVDGVWKVDLSSAKLNQHLMIQSIDRGIYRCTSCKPAYAIPADGKFHAVTGHPGMDAAAVNIVDPRTAKVTQRLGGKVIGTSTLTVSADGRTEKLEWSNIGANGKVVNGQGLNQRVAAGAKGSHAVSGSWRAVRAEKVDEAGLTMTMKEAGGMLHVSYPTGESFDAKIGGGPAPIKGDLANTMVTIKRTGANTIVETDMVKGKVVAVTTMTMVNPTTMTFVNEDRLRGGTTRYTARKS